MTRLIAVLIAAGLAVAQPRPETVRQVRAAINAGDFERAGEALSAHKAQHGADSLYLEALSWMGRGKLAAKDYEAAARYAEETRKRALEMLKGRKLDDDRSLPTALGASIEVQAQVMNARGEKAEAVSFLQQELRAWRATSIRTRIQKNLHLISLEGKFAPPLAVDEFIGRRPPSLPSLKGKPVLLFFWAHWCGDCKSMAAPLAKIARDNPDLVVVGPTQPYGYAAGGVEAPRAEEVKYIEAVWQQHYSQIAGMTVPVSEENFKSWGASTTPTLVLINKRGVVRLYHPGKMPFDELQTRVAVLLR